MKEGQMPDLGSSGYFTKEDFKKVLQTYVGPALNGLSLAIEEMQKTIDTLEKASRKIEVTIRVDKSPLQDLQNAVPEDRSAGEQH
jgi:hypothetical protein